MIASCLIVPTERPVRLGDIKRALLTYDRVYVMSPDDRDIISPQFYLSALMGFPMALPVSSVRRLGKIPNYDDAVQRVLDDAAPACEQGLVQVISTPQARPQFPLVSVPPSDGTPQALDFPGFMGPVYAGGPAGASATLLYQTYRHAGSDPELIAAVSRGMEDLLVGGRAITPELAPTGLDDFPNAAKYGPVALPYPKSVPSGDARRVLDHLCQARVASAVRSIAMCDERRLAPLTSDPGMAAFIQQLNARVAALNFGQIDERVVQLVGIQQLHDVVIAEYVDEALLRDLSIDDIVRMRTTAWGKARESRATLGRALVQLVGENRDAATIKSFIQAALAEHKMARDAWKHEQSKLITNVTMTLGAAAVGGAAHVERIFVLGVPGAVLAAAIFGGKWICDNVMQIQDALHARGNVKDLVGYSLVQPYEPFLT